MSVKRFRENQLIKLQAAPEADPGDMRANQTTTWRSRNSVVKEANASFLAVFGGKPTSHEEPTWGHLSGSHALLQGRLETESEGMASEIYGWSLPVACPR